LSMWCPFRSRGWKSATSRGRAITLAGAAVSALNEGDSFHSCSARSRRTWHAIADAVPTLPAPRS
jgi:hypothetical protein